MVTVSRGLHLRALDVSAGVIPQIKRNVQQKKVHKV